MKPIKGKYCYFHDLFHYDQKGLVVRRELLDKKQQLECQDYYLYNRKNQLVRIERKDSVGELLSPIVKYGYNKDGILISEERMYSPIEVKISRAILKPEKPQAMVRSYDENGCLQQSSLLQKFCESPERTFEDEWAYSEIICELVAKGYRVMEKEDYDEDGSTQEKYSYFYDPQGYLRSRPSWGQAEN